jgi:hypothetical protein
LGLSARAGLSRYIGTFVGTEKYWTPEMQERGESHPTNDLYCMAASYLSLMTNLSPAEFREACEQGQQPAGLNASVTQVVAAALHPQAELRPRDGAAAWVVWLERAMDPRPAAPSSDERKGSPETSELRLSLLRRLEEISPVSLLDTIIFLMDMPQTVRPSQLHAHGARCVAVVDWVQTNGRWTDLATTLDRVNGPL